MFVLGNAAVSDTPRPTPSADDAGPGPSTGSTSSFPPSSLSVPSFLSSSTLLVDLMPIVVLCLGRAPSVVTPLPSSDPTTGERRPRGVRPPVPVEWPTSRTFLDDSRVRIFSHLFPPLPLEVAIHGRAPLIRARADPLGFACGSPFLRRLQGGHLCHQEDQARRCFRLNSRSGLGFTVFLSGMERAGWTINDLCSAERTFLTPPLSQLCIRIGWDEARHEIPQSTNNYPVRCMTLSGHPWKP
jgi:hypothetical protein